MGPSHIERVGRGLNRAELIGRIIEAYESLFWPTLLCVVVSDHADDIESECRQEDPAEFASPWIRAGNEAAVQDLGGKETLYQVVHLSGRELPLQYQMSLERRSVATQ